MHARLSHPINRPKKIETGSLSQSLSFILKNTLIQPVAYAKPGLES
jgi:hypothetical protein